MVEIKCSPGEPITLELSALSVFMLLLSYTSTHTYITQHSSLILHTWT